jgi:predicted Rossmann-fold nucleotide-binding protein
MTQDNLDNLLSQLNLNHKDIITKAIQDLLHIDKNSTSLTDVRMTQVTIQELKETFDVYQSTRDTRKACIFGSARSKPDHPNYIMTEEVAKRLIDIGFDTITGAGPGIMEAGNKGAGRDHSYGLNIILPFEQEANEFILNDPKLIDYKYFYTRKLAFIKESHASICFPGGF